MNSIRQTCFILAAVIAGISLPFVPTAEAQQPSVNPDTPAEIKVKRIRPEDLPDEEESSFPAVLKQTKALPRPASLEQLRKGATKVRPSVFEVVTVQIPKPPLRPTPMLVHGHAVWMSAEDSGARPILVTPHSWLVGADSIWVRVAEEGEAGSLPRAKTKQLADFSDSRSAKRFLRNAKKEGWTTVKTANVDKHRNLATLVAADGEKLAVPDEGLELFDVLSEPTSRVYGYSPSVGSALVTTQYVEGGDDLALSYYLQTTFGAILGAPIVTEDGKLVGLTVFRHPEEPGRTLVVPPLALTKYVRRAQGLDDGGGPQQSDLKEDK